MNLLSLQNTSNNSDSFMLWNNRFTDDMKYVPYVVTTIHFTTNVTYRIRLFTVCNYMSNTAGVTCGTGSVYPYGAPRITPSFQWGSCCLVFSFLCCIFCAIICLFVFLFLAVVLSVYIRFMSFTVSLVSFAPLY